MCIITSRIFRYCFLLLLFLNISSKASEMKDALPNYSGIFTSKIYDQSEIEFPESYTVSSFKEDEDTQKEIKAELRKLKKAHIDTKCISFLDAQLQEKQYSLDSIKRVLDQTVDEMKDHQNKGSWLRTAVDTTVTMTSAYFGGPLLAGLFGGVSTRLTGTASDSLKGEGTKEVGRKALKAQVKMQECELIQQEIRKINIIRESYLEGIKREPEMILTIEREYILRKKFLPSKLQEKIEDALMEIRAITFSHFEKAESFLNKALQIPLQYLDISSYLDDKSLCRSFNESSFFSNFSNTMKIKLKKVIYDIFLFSEENSALERKCYYFFGTPGIGKSCAAKEITSFLNSPCFEMSVRSEEDLSQASMEGSPRSWQGSKLGYLAEALLSTDSEGNSYRNPVLIINDFDRVFLNNSVTSLSFLLHYLDPNTKYFKNNYFGCNFDISKFTIIITGNQKIPNEEKYKALRERLEEIEFDALPQTSYKRILQQYAASISEEVEIPAAVNGLVNSQINRIVREGSNSIRAKKVSLRNFIISKKLESLEVSINDEERNKSKKGRKRKKEEASINDEESNKSKRGRKK